MLQLGISAFYHDSAACIIQDGKVIAAAEEERFTEIKHDSSFPVNAITYVLSEAGIEDINNINEVCWYEKPKVKKDRVLKTFNKHFFKTLKNRFIFLYNYYFNSPKNLLKRHFRYKGIIKYTDHHLSHAAFSYFISPYKKAAILTVDGVGEWETITISKGEGPDITKLYSINFPNSLGMLYSTITAFLGFKPNEGEYKVMGLAPFGNPDKYLNKLSKIFNKGEHLSINQKYFTWEYSGKIMFDLEFCMLLGLGPRLKEEPITQDHKDLAAALQKIYEREFEKLLIKTKELTDTPNICLGGGCAYNGVANVLAYKYFKSVFIPFAPSDAGSAIGACLINDPYSGHTADNSAPYLGNGYTYNEIKKILINYRDKVTAKYFDYDKLVLETAKIINDQKIVAWFQGRMEFGARALGNRSILASPRDASMRDKLNRVIKKREGFRPFAPSVTVNEASKWFDLKQSVPYMNIVLQAKTNKFEAATHIDGSCRVQTVDKNQNKLYYNLLKELGKISGAEVVLNTSYNLKDQTITRTPEQAIERFLDSDIDNLVIDKLILSKK
jgi:carbamoyltransferase